VSENDGFAQEFYWKMREAITGRLSRDAKRIAEKEQKNNSRPFENGRDFVKGGDAIDSRLRPAQRPAAMALRHGNGGGSWTHGV
jgi:hypothetical protein